ncbi:MAG: low-complexity protein [Alphaproteobacteria bacterium PA2]|nr:MAG: low-complexity protein [Alphaproteobacteria bacterium PA2]
MLLDRSALDGEALPLEAAVFERMVKAHEDLITGRSGGARLIARFIIAQNFRCDRRNLADCDMTGSVLEGTTFVGTNLQRAALYCADLTRCDFRGARLDRADLRGSTFVGAKMEGSILDEADMRPATLCAADDVLGLRWRAGAGFGGGGLSPGNPDMVEAFAVNFSNCSMRGVRLRNANLKNAIFTDANLDGADLYGARLDGATFRGAILTNIDLDDLRIPAAALEGCVTDPTPEAARRSDMIRQELSLAEEWVRTNGRHGRPANLDEFDLRVAPTAFQKRELVGFSARRCMAIGVDFSETRFPGANFDGADLRGAVFRDADLRGASFRGANLMHANFLGANLGALPLRDGRKRGVQFDGAKLDGTGMRLELI